LKYKVVMTDHVYPDLELEKKLLNENDAEFVFLNSKDPAVIAPAVVDADAVITCYANISEDIIKGMTKCRSISKTGIGVNNIDATQASKQGIKVLNCTDYCIEEVSDHTVALLLAVARKVVTLANNVSGGQWSLDNCYGGISRLKGKTFGLLGFGRIARCVAEKVKPYGMNIIAYDPYIPADVMSNMGVTKAEIDEVFAQADIISLNLPLTPETKGMINAEAIAKMKDGVIIVNTSRGPLINEPDLVAAVNSGKVAGAGPTLSATKFTMPTTPCSPPRTSSSLLTPLSTLLSLLRSCVRRSLLTLSLF